MVYTPMDDSKRVSKQVMVDRYPDLPKRDYAAVPHDNWTARISERFLRGVFERSPSKHVLLPVHYLIDPRNDWWAADDYDINIQDSRVLIVVQKGNGLPVKFYNADLWQFIKQYMKAGTSWVRPARLLLVTQEEIGRWDEAKGEVIPPPVAPPDDRPAGLAGNLEYDAESDRIKHGGH